MRLLAPFLSPTPSSPAPSMAIHIELLLPSPVTAAAVAAPSPQPPTPSRATASLQQAHPDPPPGPLLPPASLDLQQAVAPGSSSGSSPPVLHCDVLRQVVPVSLVASRARWVPLPEGNVVHD